MSAPVIRIFSDLHYRDATSRLQTLAAFAPLLRGADEIIFNGDTVDTQIPPHLSHLDEVRAFFAHAGPRVTFLSGNHDPDISTLSETSLCDDRVWITHGDVFFDEIAPWSRYRPEFARRLAALTANIPPAELALIETRLRLNRLVCRDLPENTDLLHHTFASRLIRLFRALFPPEQALTILRSWRDTPRLVATLTRAQRPRARVVILGHTHYPGVWRVPGSYPLTVINTGTWSRPFAPRFVELSGNRIRVIRINAAGGAFHPGRVVAEFPLAD